VLTKTIGGQVSTIGSISKDLDAARILCSGQADTIASAERAANEAMSAARTDRKARALLEVELVDVQEKLAHVHQEVKLPPQVVIEAAPVAPTRHDLRIRSGQRVSALGDLVVTKQVSACAELMAKGSIHIYGAMQGRAHAGCEGDRTARIYCLDFHAEQVAIAGRVVVFETIPAELVGRSVEVWLDDEDIMQVRPMNIP